MMQQVAELVEDRLHLAMRQQGWFVAHRRRQISADQAQVRLDVRQAREKGVHPGAAALIFTRIKIGVEGPNDRSPRFVANRVIAYLWIPDRHTGFGRNHNSEYTAEDGEHP